MLRQTPKQVDILILGAGWTSKFLIPLLSAEKVTYAATTTTGRDDTIPFKFTPDSSDTEPYKSLPPAKTVLITFPLVGPGQSKHLTGLYRTVHGDSNQWIQLGSTEIFNQCDDWSDENSAYDRENKRAVAEDELMRVVEGCVLDLAGLYGGTRVPRTWIPRLAKSKEDVRDRKIVHFVHGEDVALAILLAHRKFSPAKRWIIADMRVYDWWDLILSFSVLADGEDESEEQRLQKLRFGEWVGELMVEDGVKALPRDPEGLGRRLDSRGFWQFHGSWPRHRRLA
ncbi:hypothetical protein CC80DRAFT_400820 [Byssothecium circinans]|uniref:NAD(P)-binding protein n=1 Tax=Byssothecium circinans TaxID=147558 RepID=A0A6A5UB12_9PLEO|nr:hypothetical protein CC80DRAFT_400820 [Byssothecium circinans]